MHKDGSDNDDDEVLLLLLLSAVGMHMGMSREGGQR